MLLAFGPEPAAAAVRQHVVVAILAQPGATSHATVTLPNGRPAPLAVHQTLPDGTRIDVPLRVTVTIASTDAKSTTTLRPDTSFTLVSTGAGERSSVAHGSAVFSVLHGALDFFQVKYGNAFTASARGTVFSLDTAGRRVRFACARGVVDVAYAARLQIGAAKRDGRATSGTAAPPPVVRTIDVIAATGTPSVSFPTGVSERVRRFDTAAAARASYDAELALAQRSGDPERVAAAYNNRGTVDSVRGDFDRAIVAFNEAIRLDPNDPTAYYNRGNAYYHKGDYPRAIASYDETLRLDPEFASAYTNRGAAHDALGDAALALADYTESLRLRPVNPIAYYDRGNNYKAKRDYAHAIADYTEAIRLDPSSAETYYNRGLASSDAGDEDRAILDYTAAIRLRPNYPFAYNNRGVSYDSKGDHARAFADYDRAVQLDPTDALAIFNRGSRLRLDGQIDRAIADFTEAIRLDPKYVAAYRNRGLAYDAKGDNERAIADYEQALRLDPSLGSVSAGLGADYFAAGDRERALARLSAAIALLPERAFPYDMRGLVNLYGGSLAQARADFEKAAALAPADAFTALLVEVSSRRARAPSRLAEASARLDMTVWPAPIVRLFLGQSTVAAMLSAARDPDPAKQRAQLCNANFYAAEYALLGGAAADAAPLYRLAARDCPDHVQRGTARAALEALGLQP
jgi:tetratricopeptide (TPR) repeat protein